MKLTQYGMCLLEIEDGKVAMRDFIDTPAPLMEEIER